MVKIGPFDVPSWALALGGGIGVYYMMFQDLLPRHFQLPLIGAVPFGDLGGLLILVGVLVMTLAFLNWINNTLL